MNTYTATAVYQGCEIGFGEGEKDSYAVEECIESIPQIYKDTASFATIRIIVRDSSGLVYFNNWHQYEIATN